MITNMMQEKKKVGIINTDEHSFECLLCKVKDFSEKPLWNIALTHFKETHSNEGLNSLAFIPEKEN